MILDNVYFGVYFNCMLLYFEFSLVAGPSTNGDAKPQITEPDQRKEVMEGKLTFTESAQY